MVTIIIVEATINSINTTFRWTKCQQWQPYGRWRAWESERKRISSAAVTEDSGGGDGHDPNDSAYPMGGGGFGSSKVDSGVARIILRECGCLVGARIYDLWVQI